MQPCVVRVTSNIKNNSFHTTIRAWPQVNSNFTFENTIKYLVAFYSCKKIAFSLNVSLKGYETN